MTVPLLAHLSEPFRVGFDLVLMLQFARDLVELRDAWKSREPQDGSVGKLLSLFGSEMPAFE